MIRAILVDDKKSHLNLLLKELAAFSKDVEIIGTYTTAKEAIPQIIHLQPDVLFLDIKMPGTSGFELASSVKKICSNVIYLTNYLEHAPDSYKHEAVYFIDKDRVEEFLPEAIARLKAKLHVGQKKQTSINSIHKLRRICLLGSPKIELLLFDSKLETIYELELKVQSYSTLETFIEVKKGVSPYIKTKYINAQLHSDRFANLHRYMTNFVEDVNFKLSKNNIILFQEDFFKKEKRGQYVFALPLESVDIR